MLRRMAEEMRGLRMGPLRIGMKYFRSTDGLHIFVEETLQILILILVLNGYWVIFITSIFIFVTQNNIGFHFTTSV